MSEQARGPSEACDHYAPLLAMLDDLPELSEAFSAQERAAAREHLAGCSHCQADQRASAQLAHRLRRAFGPAAASPLRTSDLLAAIGATREPALPAPAATPSRRNPIRSEVYLGDFDGGFDRMSEQDERGNGAQAPSDGKMATIPSLRPGPRERVVVRQRWTAAFGATAAAVALIVVVAALFATHARPTAPQTAHGSATQTAGGGADTQDQIQRFTMLSPTDGWAIGANQLPDASVPQADFYQYDGKQWTFKQKLAGFSFLGVESPSIQMLSPTNGWALDSLGHLARFDGTTWRMAPIIVPGSPQITSFLALDMVAPTQGWAAAMAGSNPATSQLAFLRYDGQQWIVDQSAISEPDLQAFSPDFGGISVTPQGDVWAVGTEETTLSPSAMVLVIYHRENGVWRVASRIGPASKSLQRIPHGILMTSTTTGWIVGEIDHVTVTPSSVSVDSTEPLLLRYDGTTWTPVHVPLTNTSTTDTLTQIEASGPQNIWITGTTGASTLSPSGVWIHALLLQYDGAQWTQKPLGGSVGSGSTGGSGLSTADVTTIAIAPNGDLWAGGFVVNTQTTGTRSLFWRYSHGAWSTTLLNNGK
jgi:hypothetical protein